MAEKATQRFSWAYNHEAGTVSATDNVTGATREWQIDACSDVNRVRLELYGLGKYLQDRTSAIKADGKFVAMDEYFKILQTEEWSKEREGGARFLPAIVEAIAKAVGCSAGSAQVAYRKLSDEEKQAIKVRLAKEVEAIEEARKITPSLDDLLK